MTLSPPEKNRAQQAHKWVRGFVDYGGLVVWIIAYFAGGRNLVNATWALVAGSAAALLVGLIFERRIAPLPLIAGGAALLFGGLTLFFHDARFLKMKPTVMNALFGGILLGGLALGKTPLKLLLGEAFPMSEVGWRTLTLRYGVFFLALAGLNEMIWRTQPDATWVLFRFPGLMILTLIFAVSQAPMMTKHALNPPTEGDTV